MPNLIFQDTSGNFANPALRDFAGSLRTAVRFRVAFLAIVTAIRRRAMSIRDAAFVSTTPSARIASDARPLITDTLFAVDPTIVAPVLVPKAVFAWKIRREK